MAMRHEKYVKMHTEDGVPLDVVLSRFETDLILFLATVEDEFLDDSDYTEEFRNGDGPM
jgi:hypothetical protein